MAVGSVGRLRQAISDAVAIPVAEVHEYVQHQAQVSIDETSFQQGNADGQNPTGTKGWLWVVVTPLACYFQVLLSRSQAAAQTILGSTFAGYVNSDRGECLHLANNGTTASLLGRFETRLHKARPA